MGMFNEYGIEFADLIAPLVALVITATFSAFGWYLVRSFSVWLGLKLRGYHEREEVYLNGTSAVITKLGLLSTTFLVLNGKGGDTDNPVMRWASVSNTAMDAQKIERVSLKPTKLAKEKTPRRKPRGSSSRVVPPSD